MWLSSNWWEVKIFGLGNGLLPLKPLITEAMLTRNEIVAFHLIHHELPWNKTGYVTM